jgi:hypothetical protein
LGESLQRVYVSGERRADAFALLRDVILRALFGESFYALPDVVSLLDRYDGKSRLGESASRSSVVGWYSVAVSTQCELLKAAVMKGRHDATGERIPAHRLNA